jgi:probable DNA repair protein
VEILGVEEALGSRFDALRLTGLDHQTWPSPTRRDPFIPASLQSNVPAATADGSLARARAELAGLMRSAGVVTGSYSRGSDDEQRHLTPLLGDCPVREVPVAAAVEPAPMAEAMEDTRAPAHPGGMVRGGTSVLQRQSDCPFKAFAETRLDAGDLTPPRPGLDARDRGSLVHKALEHFWHGLEGLDALRAMDDEALAQRIEGARDAALEEFARRSPLALTETGRAIEGQCLERSLARWLGIEKAREAFTVTALEKEIELEYGGLELTGKIDRIDELEGGGSAILDYKTGASGKNGWAPEERLADVQLPAYAAGLKPRPTAIAFARLRPDSMGFDGLAEVDAGIPGLQVIGEIGGRSKFGAVESWTSLVGDWRDRLESLATAFRQGHASVEPRDPQVCKYCHLHALCRINERVILPEADDE